MKKNISKKGAMLIVSLFGVTTVAISGAALGVTLSNPTVVSAVGTTQTAESNELSQSQIRFATYNLSFDRDTEGALATELANDQNLPQQVKNVAEIIQRANADVILLNEFNYDSGANAIQSFQKILREQTFNGSQSVDYKYYYNAPSNTGVHPVPAADLDGNGTATSGAGDAFGFGEFPGRYGMAILSKYPINSEKARTFQRFLWKDMPNALLPDNAATTAPGDYYSQDVLDIYRLSSKSHWDVPITVGNEEIHFLVSHPTPPVFDGPEDRNGTRNHDEIRFWADYVNPTVSAYFYDDKEIDKPLADREKYGLTPGAKFVIAGDNNADPNDGDSTNNAALQFLNNPYINTSTTPERTGAIDATNNGGTQGASQTGNPLYDTGAFIGNVRVDYVLPSANLEIIDAKVFWPNASEPLGRLVAQGTENQKDISSDHRLVYVTLRK